MKSIDPKGRNIITMGIAHRTAAQQTTRAPKGRNIINDGATMHRTPKQRNITRCDVYSCVVSHGMKQLSKVVFAVLLIASSCAVVGSYQDPQHAYHAKKLTPDQKRKLDKGDTLQVSFTYPKHKGLLIVTKGNPGKFGKYNFVEVGQWQETFDFESMDKVTDPVKGQVVTETTYDNKGNMVLRTVFYKIKNDKEFFTQEICSAELKIINSDTVLVQSFKIIDERKTLRREFNLVVLNYKEMLSDRLKTKIRVGRETLYDENGNIEQSYDHKYEDRVPAR